MKFRNKETGAILEPRSESVEQQLSDSDLFEEYSDQGRGEKPLSRMGKAELLDEAEKMGVKVPDGAKNGEIVELIKAARGE